MWSPAVEKRNDFVCVPSFKWNMMMLMDYGFKKTKEETECENLPNESVNDFQISHNT